jgi:hypothetical protein
LWKNHRMTTEADLVREHIVRMQTLAGEEVNPELPRDPWAPRWRVDAAWVEFECGCRAERCRDLKGAQQYDPIIFRGQPQQAVYDHVCDRHLPGMNKYVHFGHFVDFQQWKRARRAILMGKVEGK